MRFSCTFPITVRHLHVDAEGPGSRLHGHAVLLRVHLEARFNVRTGLSVPADDFNTQVGDLLVSLGGETIDLTTIPGIRPTMESFALYIKERLARLGPITVAIDDGVFGVRT